MRPLRIELEGFSAFRAPTVVDFRDAELFAFVGATGSGKSSVIDGMIFALYGSVPRYDDDRLVHPVISQGKPEARVRLDFELGGRTYTAVRVVRRTKTGATTKEARLESGDEVLADDAKSLQAAVTDLLGLDLGQFTKCVVLPQGAFAQLLHDTSSKRQDLLVKLLDFGIYERVAKRARVRVQEADQHLAVLDAQLGEMAGATDEAIAELATRAAAIEGVVGTLDGLVADVSRIDEEHRTALATRAALAERRRALEVVEVPDGVDRIAAQVRATGDALRRALDAEAAAASAVDDATAALEALGDPAALRALLEAHARVAELTGRVTKGRAMVAEQEALADTAEAALAAAAASEREAQDAQRRAQRDHAAADVARHLHVGDECPVCTNTITTLPDFDDQALRAAEQAVVDAQAQRTAAGGEAANASARLQVLRDKLAELEAELASVTDLVADAPSEAEVRSRVDALVAAETALQTARTADRAARDAAGAARADADRAAGAETDARQAFAAARDGVAALGPPAPGDDLAADWDALAAWATAARRDLDEQDAAAAAAQQQAAQARTDVGEAMVRAARDVGIEATPDRVRDACVAAAASARDRHADLVAQRERAGKLRAEQTTIAEARSVDDLLAKELHPRRFEAWLLDEALAGLVAGASERLETLSSGRYALGLDDKAGFEVIDHANADERRLARTLSGGETFLASLALALALAERVSELSATGQRSLDAIFLDEGFGTLDPDTLDVVASAIEELGASGRMVGVISHVRELAERVPVRYEVRRGSESSTVERVDA